MPHSPLTDTQSLLAGEQPPAHYGAGWRAEYDAVVRPGGLGVMDRSWLGLLELTGRDRLTFLQGMVSNDVGSVPLGAGCRAALLDSTGHILADLYVHVLADRVFIETDPRCLERVRQTLEKYLIMEKVLIRDVSAQWAVLSLLGEGGVISELMGDSGVPRRHAAVPATDFWLPAEAARGAWEIFVSKGAVPVGLEASEALRVEAGLPAWGSELSEALLLPEAGMEDAVSYTKGCYVGQEIVARIAARGHTNRALRAILLAHEAAAPKPGDTVHVPEGAPEAGREVGRITSAVVSPKFGGRALALAYVRREYSESGTPVAVHLRQPGGAGFIAPAEVRLQGK